MGRGGQPVITKMKCIVICWFLFAFIGSQIYFGYYEVLPGIGYRIETGIAMGIGYILYPFFALYMFLTSLASGKQKLIDDVILILGVLGVVYILIPLVVSVVFDRMKK